MPAGALAPFAYVMPALSATGDNAAFYSETFRPAGVTRIETGAMTLGQRDGAPFFHCHALWREADGRANGGHILPEETVVAEPSAVEAFGMDGAGFVAEPDPETNFKLFGPVPSTSAARQTTGRAFALRLRPNQDFAGALEAFCASAASRRQSSMAASAGPSARALPTAASSSRSRPKSRSARPVSRRGRTASRKRRSISRWSTIPAAWRRARCMRGDNPVLMTMELVLEVLQ